MADAPLPDFRAAPTRRDEAWSGNHVIVACFGDRCLRGRLRKFVRGLNTEPVFTLAFAESDLAEAAPDLVTVVRVYTEGVPAAPVVTTLIFTGYVESLDWQGSEATVVTSPMVALKTQRIGGLSVFGMSPGELMWTFVRLGGFGADEIKIGDEWPPPLEEFFVVAPIEGIDLEFAEQVGDVMFTPDAGLRRQWKAGASIVNPIGSEYLTEFRSTKIAAVTSVRATLVLEAEQVGVARIRAATSRLALQPAELALRPQRQTQVSDTLATAGAGSPSARHRRACQDVGAAMDPWPRRLARRFGS